MFAAQDGATPNDKLYVDDVFSAYTYTGDGASTRVITNGIDLAGNGGMVWIKGRDVRNHAVFDTARGTYARLTSNSTDAQVNPYNFSLKAFNSNGFSIGSAADVNTVPSINYVSWTFRKAAKFFDVVTYTGNGSAGQTLNHSLGVVPGIIITKITSTAGGWNFYHRSLGNNYWVYLNQASTKVGPSANITNNTDPTATQFTVGANANANTHTYVAYLFAHDTSADGLVQCGSFTTDGSGNATVTLGWEPQYILWKPSSSEGDWQILDSSRNLSITSQLTIKANLSNAEAAYASSTVMVNATGFTFTWAALASTTCIYLAIRRPNKPPTTGTQVYNAIARTGTGAAATVTGVGFAPDLVALHSRSGTTGGRWEDRLRGATKEIVTEAIDAESAVAQSITSFDMDGFSLGTDGDWNTNTATYINHCFKRVPGVFDVVCYTGTGSDPRDIPHGLTVQPEFVLVKDRSTASNWFGWHIGSVSIDKGNISLNRTNESNNYGLTSFFTSTTMSSYGLQKIDGGYANVSGSNYVAYLFASKKGISKCGIYTGNGGTADSSGTSQTINCGFTTGARFVLLKCTSHTSDWVVVDTVRGLVAGNDPAISLNTTVAEVTSTDLLDPDTSGFVVNQLGSGTTSANFNVTGRSYIFLAFS